MANLSQFLASGGTLTPDDMNTGPPTDDVIGRRLGRWRARGRQVPFGMNDAQFREYVRRVRERPGQENAILAEMGLAGTMQPTARTVRTLPISPDAPPTAAPPTFEWEQHMGGFNPNAATAPPSPVVADLTPPAPLPPPLTPPPTPTPPERTADIGPWATTVNREPSATPNIGNALANAIPESATVARVVNPGLLAGLGPPLPPPAASWLSNPLEQRRPRPMRRMFG